jgi:hypothetical protein
MLKQKISLAIKKQKKQLIILVFILLLFGYPIIQYKLNDHDILYQYYNYETYHQNNICESNLETNHITTFDQYLTINTQTNYQKDYFKTNEIIQINNIITTKDSILRAEEVFLRDDALYIVVSEESTTSNPSCGEVVIEMNKDVTYEEIIFTTGERHHFTDGKIQFTLIDSLYDEDYLIYRNGYAKSITQVRLKEESNYIEVTGISFRDIHFSSHTARYYFNEETPYLRFDNTSYQKEATN